MESSIYANKINRDERYFDIAEKYMEDVGGKAGGEYTGEIFDKSPRGYILLFDNLHSRNILKRVFTEYESECDLIVANYTTTATGRTLLPIITVYRICLFVYDVDKDFMGLTSLDGV